ncbi:MAG: hypothetical protein SFU86_14620 [Pirellulaceae bacterium]|nr:hypothetical protein [Pirellulaceae bacterium]
MDSTLKLSDTSAPSGLFAWLEANTPAAKLDGCLLLTLIDLMLWGSDYWYTRIGLFLLCAPGIVFPKLRYSPWLWVGIAALFAHMILINWAWADNHKYVMTYWSLGIAMSLFVGTSQRLVVLATNANMILGLSMLFATIWKLISPEYTSGAFFEILFLTDRRFDGTMAMITDLTFGQLQENQARVRLLREGYLDWINPESQQLHSSAAVRRLAFIATWWTVFIEGIKGLLFLIPSNSSTIFFLRNLSLIVFCFTTYVIAPVPGFGCTLACMGMATCIERGEWWYRLYQVAYLNVVFWTIAGEPIREMIVAR